MVGINGFIMSSSFIWYYYLHCIIKIEPAAASERKRKSTVNRIVELLTLTWEIMLSHISVFFNTLPHLDFSTLLISYKGLLYETRTVEEVKLLIELITFQGQRILYVLGWPKVKQSSTVLK